MRAGMNFIQQAAQLANALHSGQKRAGGEPYINHPMRVAGMVMLLDGSKIPGVIIGDDMIVAAWLHDVYEDTRFSPPMLVSPFNTYVNQYVVALTNVYTKDAKPGMNREQRKKAETKRLANVSPQAQVIKLCDRIDNLQTIGVKGKKFSLVYCDESEALAEALAVAPALQLEIFKLTRGIRRKLQRPSTCCDKTMPAQGLSTCDAEVIVTQEAEALATVKTTLATKYDHGFQPAETVMEYPEPIDLDQIMRNVAEEDRCNDCGGDGIACGGCEFQRP